MLLACQKGCGVPINVTMEMLQEAESHGVPFVPEHADCELNGLNEYRVTVSVARKRPNDTEEELLWKASSAANGRSLSEVFDKVVSGAADNIEKVRGLTHIIEVDDPEKNTEKKEG